MRIHRLSIAILTMTTIVSSSDETSLTTAALLSDFGYSSNAVFVTETPLPSSAVPLAVSTNGCELTLYNYSAMHGLVDSERPDQFRIVFLPGNPPPVLLGTGFVYHGPTNSLVEMATPLVANPMPLTLLKEYWSPVPDVTGVCLRGTPTNMPPTRVFLARRGAVCILKSTTVTNLIELAEIICDTLSPPAEGGAP